MRRISSLFALLAVALLISSPISAADRKDGTPVNADGTPGNATVIGGYDGAMYRMLRVDNNGVGSATDPYRDAVTTTTYPQCVSLPVNTGFKILGSGWSAYPFMYKALWINRVATGAQLVDACRLYLMSSDDNINFAPVIAPFVSTGAQVDTVKMDTVTVVLPSANPTATWVVQFSPSVLEYAGRYLVMGGIRDSTFNGTASNQKVTLVWYGRQR